MRSRDLLVISHKPCWRDGDQLRTTGGFPRHIAALCRLDADVTLAVPISAATPVELTSVLPPDLKFVDLGTLPPSSWRKTSDWLKLWIRLIGCIRTARKVHVLGPSSVSLLAIIAAWCTHTPLSARYCGVWDRGRSGAERAVIGLLKLHAYCGGVVFATGVAPNSTASKVRWIFSTSLWQDEIDRLAPPNPRVVHEPVRLGCVQRLVSSKRTDIAIKAVHRLNTSGVHASLVVIGDGPERQRLELLAQQLGLPVEFCGQMAREDAVSRLHQLDVLVFPSESEGFPKAVSEAQACGIPIVAADDSGLDAIIEDSGLLVSPTADSFASALTHLVSDDEPYQLASKAGVACAQQRSLERWAAIIGQAIGRPVSNGASR